MERMERKNREQSLRYWLRGRELKVHRAIPVTDVSGRADALGVENGCRVSPKSTTSIDRAARRPLHSWPVSAIDRTVLVIGDTLQIDYMFILRCSAC